MNTLPPSAGVDARLIVVGLGPGRWEHLTLEAWEILRDTPTIYLRTARHPTVDELRDRLPETTLVSFDDLYETADSFEGLYDEIARRLLTIAHTEAMEGRAAIYAVPGHPLAGERVSTLLREQAEGAGVHMRIVEGLSFLEPVFTALGFDPLGTGVLVLDAAALAGGAEGWDEDGLERVPDPDNARPPSPRLVETGQPLVLAQLYSSAVASAAKLWLLERYPPDHQCVLLRAAGLGAAAQRMDVALAELDHAASLPVVDYLTTLYVPPLERLHDLRSLQTLAGIVARLRAPGGCPWDREQDHQTLKPHLLEETYEVLDALDREDWDNLVEELGDLMLQVVMHAQFAEEAGTFDLTDVAQGINAKLIRRHPHVFGTVEASTSGQVLVNWEAIKRTEKAGRGENATTPRTLLEGIPRTLPALAAAQTIGRKVARVGFEWPSVEEVYAKLDEEIGEVRGATTASEQSAELGDLLFTVVNLCRHLTVDAEEALRQANRRFTERYNVVEELSSQEWAVLWMC